MYEVEVKVRAAHDEVRERLRDLDAEHIETVTQEDTYYDAPHRDFAETDEALRIRREARLSGTSAEGAAVGVPDGEPDEAVKVTYKGPLVEEASKTREEFETSVGDDDAMQGILEGLGFEPAAVVEKERKRFALDGYTVTLDRVSDLGEFVEVEQEAPEEQVAEIRAGAYDVLRDLGLDPDEQIRTSYLGLLLESGAAP